MIDMIFLSMFKMILRSIWELSRLINLEILLMSRNHLLPINLLVFLSKKLIRLDLLKSASKLRVVTNLNRLEFWRKLRLNNK
jgi:hypothetical protein